MAAAERTEPQTGVSFAAAQNEQRLLACGCKVRSLGLISLKVYAVGVYADAAAVRALLAEHGASRGAALLDGAPVAPPRRAALLPAAYARPRECVVLARRAALEPVGARCVTWAAMRTLTHSRCPSHGCPNAAFVSAAPPTTLRLVFMRAAPGEKIAGTLAERLKPMMPRTPASDAAIAAFSVAMSASPISAGDAVELAISAERMLTVSMAGAARQPVDSRDLCCALLACFAGAGEVVDARMRDALAAALAACLAEDA